MKKELEINVEQWKKMERGAAAEKYYEEEIMPLNVEDFIERNKEGKKLHKENPYMVFSVGTSFGPLVLNISLFEPQKILFMYTKKTKEIVDKVVGLCRLDSSCYQKCEVNEVDSLDIYKKIKDVYLEWGKPKELYIDFTGGTKAMSVAAAMVGAVVDLRLIYVGSQNYLSGLRQPAPGSETLYFISNPYAVFGDFEIEKAMAFFGQYNYSGAREKLDVLQEKVPDQAVCRQLYLCGLLARGYEHWDALEFDMAHQNMAQLAEELQKEQPEGKVLLVDCIGILKEQLEILTALKNIQAQLKKKGRLDVMKDLKYMAPLMFTMQTSAFIRREQKKYDFATLLLYRLLEMMEQHRLAEYGIDVSNPDYTNIKFDKDKMPEMGSKRSNNERVDLYEKKVLNVKKTLYGRYYGSALPREIALMEGYVQLLALKDDLINMRKLRELQSAVTLRNKSIFAHGLSPVSENNYKNFEKIVIKLFKDMCSLEQIDYNAYCDKMKWVNPLETKNYSFGTSSF